VWQGVNVISYTLSCGRMPNLHPWLADFKSTEHLVDFFDVTGLADAVCTLRADPTMRARLGAADREFACAHYA